MATSIKQSYVYSPTQEQIEQRKILTDLLADLTAIRSSVTGITAKLDLDAGVTDVNYASTLDPAALTITA